MLFLRTQECLGSLTCLKVRLTFVFFWACWPERRVLQLSDESKRCAHCTETWTIRSQRGRRRCSGIFSGPTSVAQTAWRSLATKLTGLVARTAGQRSNSCNTLPGIDTPQVLFCNCQAQIWPFSGADSAHMHGDAKVLSGNVKASKRVCETLGRGAK